MFPKLKYFLIFYRAFSQRRRMSSTQICWITENLVNSNYWAPSSIDSQKAPNRYIYSSCGRLWTI